MGRWIGRRPDETRKIAKRVHHFLNPGEEVLAGVYLQQPGTMSAELQGGVSGAVKGAVTDLPPSIPDPDPEHYTWVDQVARFGVDEPLAKRAIHVSLVLTSERLLVVRRSRLLRGRAREVVIAWPLAELDRVEVPRNGGRVTVHHPKGSLTFELPQAHKFLPQVYRDLPRLFERASGRQATTR